MDLHTVRFMTEYGDVYVPNVRTVTMTTDGYFVAVGADFNEVARVLVAKTAGYFTERETKNNG